MPCLDVTLRDIPRIFVQNVDQREVVDGEVDASEQLLFDERRNFPKIRVLLEKCGLGAMAVDRSQVAEDQSTDFRGEQVVGRPHDGFFSKNSSEQGTNT